MGTLSEKLTRIKNAMDSIRSGFDLQNAVIESVASTTTELHATQTVTIAENTATIQDLNTTLNARNNEINRLNTTVTTQENVIAEQGATITNLNNTVDEQVVEISTLQNTIVTKDATINELNETVLAKDNEIAELNERIEELENPSTPEPEYIYLTVAMKTNDNSSLPDDFTYSIDVYDADNNAIYTNISPDAISGEHNEVAFSDMPEDFIVGNTYTVTARSWSSGYSLITENPYYITVDHSNTEACFMLQPEAEPDAGNPTYTYMVNTEEEREAITGMEADDTCYVAEESWGVVTGAVGESLNKITMDDGYEAMLNASTSAGEQIYTSDSGNITMTFSSTGTVATLTYTDTTNSTINEETGETIGSFTYAWYYDEMNFCWNGNGTNAILQLPEPITYNGDGSTWVISSFVKKYGPGIYKYQGGTYPMWVRL